jgi:hypothetical protein
MPVKKIIQKNFLELGNLEAEYSIIFIFFKGKKLIIQKQV